MARDHDHCFLCQVHLTEDNRTVEHVFPRWLQRAYKLWNQPLTLPNQTKICYRQLTIPCCKECNGHWLKQIEDRVAEAVRAGPSAVNALDETVLCLWMAKIYYGLRFKELGLPLHRRRDVARGHIVEPRHLSRHSEIHHVLQAARDRIRFDRAPGSRQVFSAQVPLDERQGFDYRDIKDVPFLALRLGATVVVASLLDWGVANRVGDPYFDVAGQLKLHPLQFHEVAAHGAYQAMRFRLRFGYLIVARGGYDAIAPVIVGKETGASEAAFEPFVAHEMAGVLAACLRLPAEDLYDPASDGVWSTLLTADGQPQSIDLAKVPIGARLVPPGFYARHRDDEGVVPLGEL